MKGARRAPVCKVTRGGAQWEAFFTSSRKNWFTSPSVCLSVPLMSLRLQVWPSTTSSGGKRVYTRYIGTLDGLLLKDLEAQRERAAEATGSGVVRLHMWKWFGSISSAVIWGLCRKSVVYVTLAGTSRTPILRAYTCHFVVEGHYQRHLGGLGADF